MGHVASDIATVPATNGKGEHYNWFIFFLPGEYENQIRNEITDNFFRISRRVGKENLFVTGTELDDFHSDVLLRYRGYRQGYFDDNVPLPALMVTDTAPSEVAVELQDFDAKILYFPLADTHLREGMLSNFLRQLFATLQDAEAFENLEEMHDDMLNEKWGWVTRYFDLKPNFMGLGINLNAIIEDLANRDE